MGALRTARATWTRDQATKAATQRNQTPPGAGVTGTDQRPHAPLDPDAVAWEFDHAGHASAGDRVLVVSAALRHIQARITAITQSCSAVKSIPPMPPGAR